MQIRLLSRLVPGDVVSGAAVPAPAGFVGVDLGGNRPALLPEGRISLSPAPCQASRFTVGGIVYSIVLYIDRDEKTVYLSHRELLGTFEENVRELAPGQEVCGLWCGNGTVELSPNLTALCSGGLSAPPGSRISAVVDSIDFRACTVTLRHARVTGAGFLPPFVYYGRPERIRMWSYGAPPACAQSDFRPGGVDTQALFGVY